MSQQIKIPGVGVIVEVLQSNLPLLAWVVEEQSGKLRLYTVKQRELPIPASRVLPWCGPRYSDKASKEEMLKTLTAHQVRRAAFAAEIDAMQIWELAQGEVDQAGAEWFAGLMWDDPDPDQIAAMGHALLECKTHFKFNPPYFQVYTAEKVDSRLTEQNAQRERERLFSAGQAVLAALWQRVCKGGSRESLPDIDDDVAERLRELLKARIADQADAASESLWNEMRKGLPDHPFLPLLLAEQWGVVGPHHNHLLDQAGYAWGDDWAEPLTAEVAALEERLAAAPRDFDERGFVSVDSATTEDIDDAFHIAQDGEDYLLSLALACPALAWEFDSDLDRTTAWRATSLYLPEGTAHMLPRRVGIETYSLKAGTERPALILDMRLNAEGELLDVTPRQRWVRLTANSTYEAVEADLGSGSPSGDLASALTLAEKLRSWRLAHGAVVMDQPDPVLKLSGSGHETRVDIEVKPTCPKAQLMVSEFMILANRAIGEWATANAVPLLYRTQDITLPSGTAGVWSTPEDIFRMVKLMAASTLEPSPRPHASLAIPTYAPITSPLRRYSDFLNLGQVLSFLETGVPRLSRDNITDLLPGLNSRLESVGQVQRYRPRYWKLLYFKQRCKDHMFSAVVVEDGPVVVTVSLPYEQILLRAPKDVFAGKSFVGARFAVRLGRIDPLANEIRILSALEE